MARNYTYSETTVQSCKVIATTAQPYAVVKCGEPLEGHVATTDVDETRMNVATAYMPPY